MRLLSPLRARPPIHRRFGDPGCDAYGKPFSGRGAAGVVCDSALAHRHCVERAYLQQVCAWTRRVTRRSLRCGMRGLPSNTVRVRDAGGRASGVEWADEVPWGVAPSAPRVTLS